MFAPQSQIHIFDKRWAMLSDKNQAKAKMLKPVIRLIKIGITKYFQSFSFEIKLIVPKYAFMPFNMFETIVVDVKIKYFIDSFPNKKRQEIIPAFCKYFISLIEI